MIGCVIVENEFKNNSGEYEKTITCYLKNLTNKFRKGFLQPNLYNLEIFYTKHPIFQSMTGKLS